MARCSIGLCEYMLGLSRVQDKIGTMECLGSWPVRCK